MGADPIVTRGAGNFAEFSLVRWWMRNGFPQLVGPRQVRDGFGRENCLDRFSAFLEAERVKKKTGAQAFADFEQKLEQRMAELRRDIIAEEMARLDGLARIHPLPRKAA